MTPEKIIYTDGHDVVVTDDTLKVKHTSYRLNGIIKYGLSIVQPSRLPAAVILVTGLLLMLSGWLEVITPDLVRDLYLDGRVVSANTIALWTGAALAATGTLILLSMRKHYAVHIATAEGEKDAIVSRKREYISQIVNALGEAYNRLRKPESTYMAFKK